MTKTNNPEMIIIARNVRELSQAELASKSGIEPGILSKYEGGVLPIASYDMVSIARALNFPLSFFKQVGNHYQPDHICRLAND